METLKYYTKEEVKENNYIIIENDVYDFTNFEEKHPGGAKVLIYYRGKDGTETFNKISKHTEEINNKLVYFKVGTLQK